MYALDGDTVIDQGIHYRLVGFNTPEIHAACPAEAQLARLAHQRMQKAIAQGAVLIRVPCAQGATDRYGRACARLWSAGEEAAHFMVSAGLAEAYECSPGRGCPRRKNWCQQQGLTP